MLYLYLRKLLQFESFFPEEKPEVSFLAFLEAKNIA